MCRKHQNDTVVFHMLEIVSLLYHYISWRIWFSHFSSLYEHYMKLISFTEWLFSLHSMQYIYIYDKFKPHEIQRNSSMSIHSSYSCTCVFICWNTTVHTQVFFLFSLKVNAIFIQHNQIYMLNCLCTFPSSLQTRITKWL